ncbi:MAG: thioredoxin reductase [Candidatus Latescibacteria bacterium]|nr:thioredoxin reductase [Candidatus Latescibacterota bacterium]
MSEVLIIGDGPGGLSAALLLAKNDMGVKVFGQNETLMHKAMLYNYLGIKKIPGPEFMEIARSQVTGFGAELHDVEVTQVEKADGGFAVTDANGARHEARYLIIAIGPNAALVENMHLAKGDGGIEADRDGRTQIPGLYVIGWTSRLRKIQLAISVGDGAVAALDILSAEAGEEMHDFDLIEDEE